MRRHSISTLLRGAGAGLVALALAAAPASAATGTALDLDGDARSDYAVDTPTAVRWVSAATPTVTRVRSTGPGLAVPGHFASTSASDLAFWTQETARWTLPLAGGGTTTLTWGRAGDIAVPGNYVSTTATDELALFRPSTGQWFVRGQATVGFGRAGDIPVPADYDGDGDVDIAVFRPTTGQWFVRNLYSAWGYGRFGDTPVPGDYDGDGDDEFAVARDGTVKTWYAFGSAPRDFGRSTDLAIPMDHNGDGRTEPGVYRGTSLGVVVNRFYALGSTVAPSLTGTPVGTWFPAAYVYSTSYGD